MDKYGIMPDIIIGCAGGGSNLGGLIAPFMGEKLRGEADYRIIAVEPASCPSFTRGQYRLRFLRHRHGLPAGQDVHPRQRLHSLRRTTRAACATTA